MDQCAFSIRLSIHSSLCNGKISPVPSDKILQIKGIVKYFGKYMLTQFTIKNKSGRSVPGKLFLDVSLQHLTK